MCRKQINYRMYFVGKSERCRRMAHLSCCEVLKKWFKRLLKMCQGQGFSPVEQNYNLKLLNFKHIAIPQRVTGM